jgi:hypothetical protein
VLAERKRLSFDDCDGVQSEYTNFLDVDVPRQRSAFSDFDPTVTEARVETFMYERLHNKPNYKHLWSVVRMVLMLSGYGRKGIFCKQTGTRVCFSNKYNIC